MERVKIPVADFIKLVDEVRVLKNRLLNQDLARVDEQQGAAVKEALKGLEKKARTGAPEEVQRLQSEARRFVDAEHERTREMINSKYQKLDENLRALSQFLQGLSPIKELEGKVADQEQRQRKLEDELKVQRKVLSHEQEELERDKQLLKTAEDQLRAKSKEVEARLTNLDVVNRAKELDRVQKDLEEKIRAYNGEIAKVERDREELNKDFDQLGAKRAELDREDEALAKERDALARAKSRAAEVVARELAISFEGFVKDILSGNAAPAPAAPAPEAPAAEPAPEPPPSSDPFRPD